LDSLEKDYNLNGIIQPNGDGRLAHNFGIYANILKVPNLGIGLGYTGYLMIYDDNRDTPSNTGIITTSGPLYSGIDLQLQYTGLKNTALTFVSNVSFASSGRSVPSADTYNVGLFGQNLDEYTDQSWFAIYNALGVDYQVNDKLSVSFQFANRYGIITNDFTSTARVFTIKRSRMQSGGGGYAAFRINQYLLLQGGLAFRYLNDSYSNNETGAQNDLARRDASGGTFDIAVPIRLNLSFQKR
jgi:hypothetical protein